MWLSQDKYASHVIEKTLLHAETPMLFAMFSEILDGYEPDRLDLLSLAKERLNCKYLISNNRNAIDIMLFDQYGNYVVQTMLNVAIDVRSGNRMGDITWFTNPFFKFFTPLLVLCSPKSLDTCLVISKCFDVILLEKIFWKKFRMHLAPAVTHL